MRKLGLGLLGILLVGAIYYFTVGSEQITVEMKKQVNAELSSLQKEGFTIHHREIKEQEEHFILSFDDPAKIAQFFTRQGIQLNVNDAALLKGLKIGVDVSYLSDTYSAVSFDMYPLSLPTVFMESTGNDADKKALAQVEKMLAKKTFLMHIAVNKLGTGFKGYMKDINEVLQGEKDVTLRMNSLQFSGDLNNGKIKRIKQNLQTLTMSVPDTLDMTLSNLISMYEVTGKTPYDYRTDYSIEKIVLDAKSQFNFTVNYMTVDSTSTVKDALASATMHANTKSIHITTKGKTYTLDTFVFETQAKGLDITAFEKLQHIDVNNQQELNTLIQQMLSKGVSFEIPNFSVKHIEVEGQKLGGFNLLSKVNLDKSFDITAIERNPMSLLSSIDANLHITFSKELFSLISQQPQAMIVLMLFAPKDINGEKSYEIDLKNGKLLVNGMPMI